MRLNLCSMLTKILLLIVVVLFAWFGWRWVKRVQTIGRQKLGQKPDGEAGESLRGADQSAGQPAGPRRVAAEDLEKCPECGVFVAPRAAQRCGRPGCPYD